MTQQRYSGQTPDAALEAFINGFCRANELDAKSYSYQDRSIESDPADHSADYKFSFSRIEESGRVVYRDYEGSISETQAGYEVRHWESSVRDTGRAPKPPGETPGRLRGRRPRDRRY
ncbi:hypothetical protein ACFR9U_05665 [Halorientalis brevis]|uniref:Halobacterial output domain-containing protein n=1 Tax=Halorientalis brevis TaxID=1126241 RepID=A0ABD6C8S3_9EURY